MAAFGDAGHAFPAIALARALADRGNEAVVETWEHWRDAVEDPGGIEFTLTFSKWIKLFRATGFEILDLTEIQAPADATGSRSGVSADWAREFPSEHVWTLRKGL